jgi:hypothetical protein
MDPITTALLVAQTAAGIGKTIYGAGQSIQGRRALDSAYQAPTGKPKEYAEMLRQARESDVAQRRLDEINRSMATSTAALQRAGARGVIGGIGAVTEAGATSKTKALTAQQQEIMRALQLNIQGAEAERNRQIDRETRERTEAQTAITAGVQNVTSGLSDLVTAGTTAMEGRADMKKTTPKKTTPEFKADPNVMKSLSLETPTIGGLSAKKKKQTAVTEQTLSDIYDLEDLEFQGLATNKAGYKQGGVQKTPGAFSHSTNPIDIMKDGAKIGEMTGGEYIFNPSQAKQLKKLSKSGASPLHKFVNSLLNKPQFK